MKKEKLKIIYEDKDLIVVNKMSNILTISTEKDNTHTLYRMVSDYVKRQNKHNKIFIVHRLDKDTSGLIIFAKNPLAKRLLQDNWSNVQRKYYGLVYGSDIKDKGIIKSYLKENKTHLVYETNSKYGKLAITKYEKIKSNKLYSLLDITILTGRKHQIRVQLNNLGYPLVGDKKYSKIKNKQIKNLYLHAYYLNFIQPITQQPITLNIDYPEYFKKLI